MAADNYLSGLTGAVKIGPSGAEVPYSFGKWKVQMKTNLVKFSNFTTGGYKKVVSAITEGTITLECPVYNAGNMPLTAGNSYSMILNWTNAISFAGTARVETIEAGNDSEGAPTINVTAVIDGTFTPSIT